MKLEAIAVQQDRVLVATLDRKRGWILQPPYEELSMKVPGSPISPIVKWNYVPIEPVEGSDDDLPGLAHAALGGGDPLARLKRSRE